MFLFCYCLVVAHDADYCNRQKYVSAYQQLTKTRVIECYKVIKCILIQQQSRLHWENIRVIRTFAVSDGSELAIHRFIVISEQMGHPLASSKSPGLTRFTLATELFQNEMKPLYCPLSGQLFFLFRLIAQTGLGLIIMTLICQLVAFAKWPI